MKVQTYRKYVTSGFNGILKEWAVTGTYHGSICICVSEGEARRLFHKKYNGESILDARINGTGLTELIH